MSDRPVDLTHDCNGQVETIRQREPRSGIDGELFPATVIELALLWISRPFLAMLGRAGDASTSSVLPMREQY